MTGLGLAIVIIAAVLLIGMMFLVDDETDYYQRDQLQAFRTKPEPIQATVVCVDFCPFSSEEERLPCK